MIKCLEFVPVRNCDAGWPLLTCIQLFFIVFHTLLYKCRVRVDEAISKCKNISVGVELPPDIHITLYCISYSLKYT